jgi:hypothetical protein
MHDDHEGFDRVAALSPEAVELLLGVDEPDRAGVVLAWTASALSRLDRVEEAVALLESAASDTATYASGPRIRLVDALVLLLKEHGRKDEARRWRATRKALLAEFQSDHEHGEKDTDE